MKSHIVLLLWEALEKLLTAARSYVRIPQQKMEKKSFDEGLTRCDFHVIMLLKDALDEI